MFHQNNLFVGITELDLFWHREHGIRSNDLKCCFLVIVIKHGPHEYYRAALYQKMDNSLPTNLIHESDICRKD